MTESLQQHVQAQNFSYDTNSKADLTCQKTFYDGYSSVDLAINSKYIHNVFSPQESNEIFHKLKDSGEIKFEQWYHMPNKKDSNKPLLPLKRIKQAQANLTLFDGKLLQPHYRFPVNNQARYKVQIPMSPTVEKCRINIEKSLNLPENYFNHCVILLYRGAEDCISFHQDKTLDLDEEAVIVCLSFGRERPFVFRDTHFSPKVEESVVARSGSAVVISGESNKQWYHSVVKLEGEGEGLKESESERVSLTFRRVVTYRDEEGKVYGKGAQYQTADWPFLDKGTHRTDEKLDQGLNVDQ